jgi:hypothetical protein
LLDSAGQLRAAPITPSRTKSPSMRANQRVEILTKPDSNLSRKNRAERTWL